MLQLLGIAFIILALGIAFDLTLGGGDGISAILASLHSDKTPSTKSTERMDLINDIKDELDDLHDDLTYDNEEKEILAIKAKITTREQILNNLLKEV